MAFAALVLLQKELLRAIFGRAWERLQRFRLLMKVNAELAFAALGSRQQELLGAL